MSNRLRELPETVRFPCSFEWMTDWGASGISETQYEKQYPWIYVTLWNSWWLALGHCLNTLSEKVTFVNWFVQTRIYYLLPCHLHKLVFLYWIFFISWEHWRTVLFKVRGANQRRGGWCITDVVPGPSVPSYCLKIFNIWSNLRTSVSFYYFFPLWVLLCIPVWICI